MDTTGLCINDLGIGDSDVYIKVESHWYVLNKNGGVTSPTLLPDTLKTEQRSGGNGEYKIEESVFHYIFRYTGSGLGLKIESGAKNPAWLCKKE